MTRTIGTLAGAIGLAAGYQLLYEEGRDFIKRARSGSHMRTQTNDAIMLMVIRRRLPTALLGRIRKARNRLEFCIDLVTAEDDEMMTPEHREAISDILSSLLGDAAITA